MLRLRRSVGTLALAVLAWVCCACHIGMSADKYRPASQPAGVRITMNTAQGHAAGELLTVRDTGIIVLIDGKVHMVPYTAIQSSEIDQTSSNYAITNRSAPGADAQAHLKLISRFPQGLTPELLQQLLQAYGQTEMATP